MGYMTVEAHLRKEAEWDDMVKILPHCIVCAKPIFPHSVVYVANMKCVCKLCKELLDDGMEIY